MTTIDTATRERDFYAELMAEIEAGNVNHAVEMIMGLPNRLDQFAILSRIARALGRDLDHALDSDRNFTLALATALALARALARALDRDLDHAFTRALDLDHALVTARDLDHNHDLANNLDLERLILNNQTILASLRRILGMQSIQNDDAKPVEKTSNTFQFTFTGIDTLTPHNLANSVAPYLQALFDLQHIISDMKGEDFSQPRIVSISQNSPISVDVIKIPDAIDALFRLFSPQYRKQAKLRRELEIQEAQAEIALKEAQIAEIKSREQTQTIENDAEYKKAQLEQLRLQNEKMRFELEKEKIEFTISLIKEYAPNMPETDRMIYLQRLLKPVQTLLESPLEAQRPNTLPES